MIIISSLLHQQAKLVFMIFIDPAIVKLVRLCKTDVFALQIRGNYLAHPKWSLSKRRAKVRTKFVHVIDKNEIKALSDEEIYQRICNSIDISDIREQKENKININLNTSKNK